MHLMSIHNSSAVAFAEMINVLKRMKMTEQINDAVYCQIKNKTQFGCLGIFVVSGISS